MDANRLTDNPTKAENMAYLFSKAEALLREATPDLDPTEQAHVLAALQAHLMSRSDPPCSMDGAVCHLRAVFCDEWVSIEQAKKQMPLFGP